MFNSNVTLQELRDDLRLKLSDLPPDRFGNKQLDRALNVAQYNIFVAIHAINEAWYGKFNTYQDFSDYSQNGNLYVVNISGLTDLFKIMTIRYNSSHIPFVPFSYLLTMNTGAYKLYRYSLLGNNLYINFDPDLGNAGNRLDVFYYRIPTKMVNDTDKLDIPEVYQELVIMEATRICYEQEDFQRAQTLRQLIAQQIQLMKQTFVEDSAIELEPIENIGQAGD